MAVKFVTMKDLKERTPWVFDQVRKRRGVVVTYRGHVAGLLQAVTEEELEAFIVSQSGEVRKQVEDAVERYDRGEVVRYRTESGRLERENAFS
jgi:hypothetical protein